MFSALAFERNFTLLGDAPVRTPAPLFEGSRQCARAKAHCAATCRDSTFHRRVHRWALKMLPVLAALFRARKRSVGSSWRADETYIKVSGQWKYLYRAVDRLGQTVDFLLTAHRDVAAARRLFEHAIDRHDVPEKITLDRSGANTAAVNGLVVDSGVAIELRQSKYLNNLIEQDHRAIKRVVRPMFGFKDFECARRLIAGIEIMHMIKKGRLDCPKGQTLSAADPFYSLAF